MTLNRAISSYKRAVNELSSERALGRLIEQTVKSIKLDGSNLDSVIKYVISKLEPKNSYFETFFKECVMAEL